MDVADEFHEIRIFLTDDRFITILKEVAAPFMVRQRRIEGDRIACHEAAHDFAQRSRACAQQEKKWFGKSAHAPVKYCSAFNGVNPS